jgi:lactoylglutathione lyase
MIEGLNAIEVITLFVEDLKASTAFYRSVFGLKTAYEDKNAVGLTMGSLMINLLQADQAPKLVEPDKVASPGAGARLLLTIKVKDANAVCADLARHGVKLLNGPIDRPWGRRTAAFADPAGNVWEIAQELPPA